MANSSMYFNCTIDVSSSHHIHWHASECMNTTIFKVHANVNCHLLIILEQFVFSLCLCWCHHLISVYMRAQCNPVCFSCPSSDSLCWLVSLSVTQMIHRLVYIDSKGFNTNVPSLVQKQCVSSVPSCRIGSCIGGEEVQIHECPQFGTNSKCMCVLSVPSCRLDVDIRVSAGLTSDQHVTIIKVWYKNAQCLSLCWTADFHFFWGHTINGWCVEHQQSVAGSCQTCGTLALQCQHGMSLCNIKDKCSSNDSDLV